MGDRVYVAQDLRQLEYAQSGVGRCVGAGVIGRITVVVRLPYADGRYDAEAGLDVIAELYIQVAVYVYIIII